ncbi:MAG: EF-hand domain-containing protein [Kiritimatiellae bacterium]|nr:EF-hand domain-containing protein [Kiritimatiellia bacterium]
MKWCVWVVAAAVGVGWALSASAAPEGRKGGPGGGPAFSKLDADGDGAITCEEYVKARAPADDEAKKKAEAVFKKMDANSDGKVTKEEFAEWVKNRPQPKKGGAQPPAAGGAN